MSEDSRTLERIAGFMDVIECPEQETVCRRVAIVCRAVLTLCEKLGLDESNVLKEEAKEFQRSITEPSYFDSRANAEVIGK